MIGSRKGPPAAVVGLDIGSDSIKVAEAKYAKDGITITALGIAPTPPGVIDNDVIVDPKALGSAIKTLLAESGIKTKQCVSAVSGQSHVLVRVIEVPKMDAGELAQTMQYEVERQITFSPTQVVMDFQPLDRPNPDPNAQNMEVLLAVAQDELVNGHVEALLAAGLKPMAIDIEPLAVSRSLIEVAKNGVKEEVIAVLNIGSRNTDLGIFESGALTFPNPPLPIAGTTLTQEIADALGQTPEQAETTKKEYASVNMGAFGTPSADGAAAPAAQEPTSMGADDDAEAQAAGPSFAPAFEPEEDAKPAEDAVPADQPQGFRVTVDGPVFDVGEEAGPQPGDSAESEAEAEGTKIDLDAGAAPSAGPVFDLGEAEPSEPAAQTFDLGGSEPRTEAASKPVFDLDDEAPAATQDQTAQSPDLDPTDPGLPAPADGQVEPMAVQPAYQPGSMEDRVFQAISGVLVDLANEIRRSLEYYSSRYNKTPERIFLCGGTAKIPHLDEFLSQELGAKVEVGDPVANLNVKVASASNRYLHEISPMLAVSIGLAIRDMVE